MWEGDCGDGLVQNRNNNGGWCCDQNLIVCLVEMHSSRRDGKDRCAAEGVLKSGILSSNFIIFVIVLCF